MSQEKLAKRQQRLERLFAGSPVQRTLGTSLRFEDGGDAVVTFPSNGAYQNALGSTHGGIVATLIDTAGWFAAAACYDVWIVTVDLHMQLLAPAMGGVIEATGHVVRSGARLAMTRMVVRTAEGVEVAVGQGTFSVTSKTMA